jgi:3-oxoacyl-(acyl-carrier-protein) synthase
MRLGDRTGIDVVAAYALGAHGMGARGLGARVRERTLPPPGPIDVPPPARSADAKQRKLMSRAAWMGALAMRGALAEAAWEKGREEIGAYFGVGASGAEMGELSALLGASVEAGSLSLDRCGREGLDAVNPLFAFQIMNNFTLCHGSILEGVAGPNAAFFSRGAGTVTALEEACVALAEGTCDRAIVGGADTAMHPITLAELEREGLLGEGLAPAEGAAVLALARTSDGALGWVEYVQVLHVPRRRGERFPEAAALREIASRATREALAERPFDVAVLAPWGHRARETLLAIEREGVRAPVVIDATAALGEALAATPALAWVIALDLLADRGKGRAIVVSAGPDGDVGVVVLARGGGA